MIGTAFKKYVLEYSEKERVFLQTRFYKIYKTASAWRNKKFISGMHTRVICNVSFPTFNYFISTLSHRCSSFSLPIQLGYLHIVSMVFQLLPSNSTSLSSCRVTSIPLSTFRFNQLIFTLCHWYSSFFFQIQLVYLRIFALCHWYSSFSLKICIAHQLLH